MARWLRVSTALAEDLPSVSRTHTEQLITTCTQTGLSLASVGSCTQAAYTYMEMHTCIHMHTDIQIKILSLK